MVQLNHSAEVRGIFLEGTHLNKGSEGKTRFGEDKRGE